MNPENKVVKRIIRPIDHFIAAEASGGILLVFVTLVAMIWANSPWHESYYGLLHTPIKLSFGSFLLDKTLHHWVNDVLMVIFFFVVGLEIKTEMLDGELSSPKKAALPMFAALGGMIVPALIYLIINKGSADGLTQGWAIPMATDIAFAVGVISLLGKRVPLALKVFLLALAIVDDLGAVLVIAFFYTSEISGDALGVAAIGLALTLFAQKVGIRVFWIYAVLGLVVWLGILQSGVHATIAGVLLGFLTPAQALYRPLQFREKFKSVSDRLARRLQSGSSLINKNLEPREEDLFELENLAYESISPLDRLIHLLHPWVNYFIMPIFALFNAGLFLGELDLGMAFINPVFLGVALGLFIGKPLGVFLFCWVTVRLGFASLPTNCQWKHILSVGFLAGIGFTMALFICNLSLVGIAEESFAKIAILVASALASIIGSFLLYMSTQKNS